jgi:hypothetical protein
LATTLAVVAEQDQYVTVAETRALIAADRARAAVIVLPEAAGRGWDMLRTASVLVGLIWTRRCRRSRAHH